LEGSLATASPALRLTGIFKDAEINHLNIPPIAFGKTSRVSIAFFLGSVKSIVTSYKNNYFCDSGGGEAKIAR
jgi:hypothetical protein